MPANTYYPAISNLIAPENMAGGLGLFQDIVQDVFDDLYYKDLQVELSREGDFGFFWLKIVLYNNIGLDIPGTGGMSLLLNPDDSGEATIIPLALRYQWEIVRYLSEFTMPQFGGDPRSFFDLLMSMANPSLHELLTQFIQQFFSGDNPIQQFLDDYNTNHPDNPINPTADADDATFIQNILDAFAANGIDLLDILYNDYLAAVSAGAFEEVDEIILSNIQSLFNHWLGYFNWEDLRDSLIPQISVAITNIVIAMEFPLHVLKQWDDATNAPKLTAEGNFIKSRLSLDVGSVEYDSKEGFVFNNSGNVNFTKSEIGNTGFTLGFTNAKVDLSRTKNIPEADAAGYATDFIGVYVQEASIGLPAFWTTDPAASNVEIVGTNLLIGTGGFSGTLRLQKINPNDTTEPVLLLKIGQNGFQIGIHTFDITFQQNAIVESNIFGFLKIPGFKDNQGNDALIEVQVHFDEKGDFYITASEAQGIQALHIPDIFSLTLNSLTVGKRGGRFFIAVSGILDFLFESDVISGLPKGIEIKKLLIWEGGGFEFEGGPPLLPKAVSLQLGPAKIAITALHLGTDERSYQGELRKYKYFGFDGGLSLSPGGIDARGDGIKFYFTIDEGTPHRFVRIDGMAINLVLPAGTNPDTASLLLEGYLSMKTPETAENENSDAGTEYAGGVSVTLPKLNVRGSAEMVFNPNTPSFLVDVGLELANPIVLGGTGLGIYGFRGLIGNNYVASKEAVGLTAENSWYEYYKAGEVGVHRKKFQQTDGFSLGAGVSLATAADAGKAFSSKLFFLLSLPQVFLLEGQAQILKKRVNLESADEPPFYAMIALSDESIEAALGVNYKFPKSGAIADVRGAMELGFFFGNASAWYVNIGRDFPEEKRVRATVLKILGDAYFYMMLSSAGIRAGAGAKLEFDRKLGPLRLTAKAYMDLMGRIAFQPMQIGGGIQMGAELKIKVFGVPFGISAAAALSAEAPKPFIIAGKFKVCVKVFIKKFCADVKFTWTFNEELDKSEIPLLAENSGMAVNVHTNENFSIAYLQESAASNPDTWETAAGLSKDAFMVPMDSFIDLEFSQGIHPFQTADLLGGLTHNADYTIKVAPKKAKAKQVKHEFHVMDVRIKRFENGNWVDYDIYKAMETSDLIDADISLLKQGFWQLDNAKKYTKLRLLSQTPFSYLTLGANADPTVLNISSSDLLCVDEVPIKTCVDLTLLERQDQVGGDLTSSFVPADKFLYANGALFHLTFPHTMLVDKPYQGNPQAQALKLHANQQVEILLEEPMAFIELLLQTEANGTKVHFCSRKYIEGSNIEIDPELDYIETQTLLGGDLKVIHYEDLQNPIDKIVIETGNCGGGNTQVPEGAKLPCSAKLMIQEVGSLVSEVGYFGFYEETIELSGDNIHTYYKYLLADSFQVCPVNKAPADTSGLSDPAKILAAELQSKVHDVVFTSQKTSNSSFKAVIEVKNCICYTITMTLPEGEDLGRGLRYLTCWEIDPNPDENGCYNIKAKGHIHTEDIPRTMTGKLCLEWKAAVGDGDIFEDCCAYLYKVCYRTLENYQLVTNVESIDVEGNGAAIKEALDKTVQPLWQPDSTFLIEVDTEDRVFAKGDETIIYSNTHRFGFKTAGSIGYFHRFASNGGELERSDYQELKAADKEDQFKYKALQHYLDFDTCYPNADGRLTNAKPLFYSNPRLLLFYQQAYIYAMYDLWDYSLTASIKDPTGLVEIPTGPEWIKDNLVPIGAEASIINEYALGETGNCIEIETVTPFGVYAQFAEFALEPLKAYTAVFYAKKGSQKQREVHQYVFETSRYGSFTEQIMSYQLKDEEGNHVRDAVFEIERNVDSAQLQALTAVLNGEEGGETTPQYMHPYDRLIGALKLPTLHPALTTEFNLIRNGEGGNVIGLLIRNPEPFNDPKIPDAALADSIVVNGASSAIFSKDKANVFVSNAGLNLPTSGLTVTFKYLEFEPNTKEYESVEKIMVNVG